MQDMYVLHKKNCIEYVLPFLLLLSQYKLYVVPLSSLALLFVFIYDYCSCGFRKSSNINFIVFYLYVLLHDLVNLFIGASDSSTCFHRLLEYSFNFMLMLLICSYHFDEKRLFRVWKVATIIYSFGLFIQMIQIYILKQQVKIIPISVGLGNINTNEPYRPRSFFQEPSYLAEAMLPMLFLSLKNKSYKWAIFTTFAIICSTSTNGIIISCILWGLFLVDNYKNKRMKYLIPIIFVILCFILVQINVKIPALQKLFCIIKGGGSFSARVSQGFMIIRTLSLKQMIFGTTFNEVYDYVDLNISYFTSTIVFNFWKLGIGNVFLNGICSVIFRYGIFGMILFLRTYKGMLFNKKYAARNYAIISLVALFANDYLLNIPYFIEMIILLLYKNEFSNKLERKASCLYD